MDRRVDQNERRGKNMLVRNKSKRDKHKTTIECDNRCLCDGGKDNPRIKKKTEGENDEFDKMS
jgi:hypothetical protein